MRKLIALALALFVPTVADAYTTIGSVTLDFTQIYSYNKQYGAYYDSGDTFFSTWGGSDGLVNTGEILSWINDVQSWQINANNGGGTNALGVNAGLVFYTNTTIGPISGGGMQVVPYGQALDPGPSWAWPPGMNVNIFGSQTQCDGSGGFGGVCGSYPGVSQPNADGTSWKSAGLLDINRSGVDYLIGSVSRTVIPNAVNNCVGSGLTWTSCGAALYQQVSFNSQIVAWTPCSANCFGAGNSGFGTPRPAPPYDSVATGAYHYTNGPSGTAPYPEFIPAASGVNAAGQGTRLSPASGMLPISFIQYGQGYTTTYNGFTANGGVMPDGAGTYVYGLFPQDGFSYNSAAMALARMPVATVISKINAGPPPTFTASDWTYYNGAGDGSDCTGAVWTATQSAAKTLMSSPVQTVSINGTLTPYGKLGLDSASYIPNLNGPGTAGVYVYFHGYYAGLGNNPLLFNTSGYVGDSAIDVWVSPTPCGPWKKIQTIPTQPWGFYYPEIMAGTIGAASGGQISAMLIMAGNWQNAGAQAGYYHTWEVPIVFNLQ